MKVYLLMVVCALALRETQQESDCDCCRRVLDSGSCCGTTTVLPPPPTPPTETPAPPPPPVTTTPPCCCQTDVAIIVDQTGSIPAGAAGIVPIRTFVNKLFGALNIGPNCVHAGYMGFSNAPYVFWSLSDPRASSPPPSPGNLLPIPRNNTFTWLALNKAKDWFAADTRGTCKRVLLVTDGGSDNKTLTAQAVADLRNTGVSMCLVGLTGPTFQPVVDANRNAEAATLTSGGGDEWITNAPIQFTDLPNQAIVDAVVSCLCPSKCCGW